MVYNPRDSRREDMLITGCHILIYIYNRKNEMRGKIYSEMLYQRKQKSSIGLSNRVIMRKGMKNKSHNHVQKPRAFSKGRIVSELTLTLIRRALKKSKNKLVFGHSP